MPSARSSINNPTPTPWAVNPARCEGKKALPGQETKPIAIPARRGFDWLTVSILFGALFWLTVSILFAALAAYCILSYLTHG
jgi:hypothetical protein